MAHVFNSCHVNVHKACNACQNKCATLTESMLERSQQGSQWVKTPKLNFLVTTSKNLPTLYHLQQSYMRNRNFVNKVRACIQSAKYSSFLDESSRMQTNEEVAYLHARPLVLLF